MRKKRNKLTCLQRETIKKSMSKYAKPVNQINIYTRKVIATFKSVHEANRITGISRKTISLAARGMARHAGFYVWNWA